MTERDFTRFQIKEKRKLRQEIGVLFQRGALYDFMNVEENIMFPLTMFTEKSEEEKIFRVNDCLKRVNLENCNNLKISELSGGMVKRVSIARAIVMNPKYLLCDEPNSGLDPKTAIIIDNLIKEITEESITTIVNTHDMNSVMEIGEKIAYINNGVISWTGNKEELLESNNEQLNDFVFASELFKRLKKIMIRAVKAKKHLGQHFLINEGIAFDISNLITRKPNQKRFRNWCRYGSSNKKLAKKSMKLKVVEIDSESINYLKTNYPEIEKNIINDDFLKLDLNNIFSSNFSIIGNFPYNISSQILFKTFENKDKIDELVGMFQKEVAERIACVNGKKRGILSVLIQTFYNVEYCFSVDEIEFSPKPKVKSGVIRFK